MTKAQNSGLRTTKKEKTALRMTKFQGIGHRTTDKDISGEWGISPFGHEKAISPPAVLPGL